MQIHYNDSLLHLEDMPLDIGYASERVELKDHEDKTFLIGGQNGSTQLLISTPFIDDTLLEQLSEIDSLLSINALDGITKALIVSTPKQTSPRMEGWLYGVDYDEAFGDYYGVRIADGELAKEFAKSLFIISKDGALFYHEILSDVLKPFNFDKALIKIAAAMSCYTGKGCH